MDWTSQDVSTSSVSSLSRYHRGQLLNASEDVQPDSLPGKVTGRKKTVSVHRCRQGGSVPILVDLLIGAGPDLPVGKKVILRYQPEPTSAIWHAPFCGLKASPASTFRVGLTINDLLPEAT